MIANGQNIPCPNCQTNIPFDTKQLLMGVKFVCPGCQAEIGLSEQSKPLVQETMDKFEEMKGQFSKDK